MNVLSLFDGMSGAQLALQKLGIQPQHYFASEVDKWATKIAKKNFPNTVQLGDITLLSGNMLPKIDLLVGGSPCQGFSKAGKGLNFHDPRSKLFFEYVRLLKEIQPEYFLLENVLMKQEWQDVITEHLGVEPILINSALVSAQTRKRLYWTNIPNVVQPIDKTITWGDIRERGVDSEKYYYSDAAMQWFARYTQKSTKALEVTQDNEKFGTLTASHSKRYGVKRFFGIPDMPNDEQAVAAMRGRYLVNGKRQDGKMSTKGLTQQYIEFRYDEKTNALTTVSKDNVVVPFTLPNRIPRDEFFFRFLTPLECERLQTVPDGYTEGVSDTQRYKMLGNGFTVDVIAHILSFMEL